MKHGVSSQGEDFDTENKGGEQEMCKVSGKMTHSQVESQGLFWLRLWNGLGIMRKLMNDWLRVEDLWSEHLCGLQGSLEAEDKV